MAAAGATAKIEECYLYVVPRVRILTTVMEHGPTKGLSVGAQWKVNVKHLMDVVRWNWIQCAKEE